MKPPAFIYFDLGNVLLYFDHHRAAHQMGAVAGVAPERVWELMFNGNLLQQIESGALSDRGCYDFFCRETDTRPDYDELELAGSAIFWVNTSMLPVVAGLHGAGYRLGILSNTSASHWKYVTDGRYGILPAAFDELVLSYEVRAMKPSPEIYRVAAEQAGVAPEEIFFTDDRAENVAGARQAGFDAVQFTGAADLARELRRRGVRMNF